MFCCVRAIMAIARSNRTWIPRDVETTSWTAAIREGDETETEIYDNDGFLRKDTVRVSVIKKKRKKRKKCKWVYEFFEF